MRIPYWLLAGTFFVIFEGFFWLGRDWTDRFLKIYVPIELFAIYTFPISALLFGLFSYFIVKELIYQMKKNYERKQ